MIKWGAGGLWNHNNEEGGKGRPKLPCGRGTHAMRARNIYPTDWREEILRVEMQEMREGVNQLAQSDYRQYIMDLSFIVLQPLIPLGGNKLLVHIN